MGWTHERINLLIERIEKRKRDLEEDKDELRNLKKLEKKMWE